MFIDLACLIRRHGYSLWMLAALCAINSQIFLLLVLAAMWGFVKLAVNVL